MAEGHADANRVLRRLHLLAVFLRPNKLWDDDCRHRRESRGGYSNEEGGYASAHDGHLSSLV